MTKSQNHGKSHAPPSAYTPRLKNPVPLPSIDEFRLSNILSSDLQPESDAVAQSLLNVNGKYQQDLRLEIRRALTIEQKIQYKNIQVAKLAHDLQKRLLARRKHHDRVWKSRPNEVLGSSSSHLAADVDSVLELAQKTLNSVHSLTQRLATLDLAKGGTGLPDPGRFPRLAKLMGKLDTNCGNSARVDATDVYSASLEEPQFTDDYMDGGPFPEVEEDTQTGSLEREEVNGVFKLDLPDAKSAEIDQKLVLEPSESLHQSEDSLQSPNTALTREIIEELDSEMDADTFAMLIDSNVQKYRQKRSNSYKELELFAPSATTPHKSKGNPLRLLYSSANLENSDMLQELKLADPGETFHSPFLLAKSIATVSETPQLSLHKKLRINALPMSFSSSLLSQNSNCDCSQSDDSPARKALAATLLRDVSPENKPDDDELWSSLGLYTETEENESDQLLWSSSSDPDSSSDSQGHNAASTNEYYRSLHRNLTNKKRKKRRHKMQFTTEASPTPKHQPSHRILKPRQSILKMRPSVSKARLAGRKSPANSPKKFLPEPNLDTPYRLSPRGSFVNNYSAIGVILQSGEQNEDSDTDDGDLADNEPAENGSVSTGDPAESRALQTQAQDQSLTVSKLRKLLI